MKKTKQEPIEFAEAVKRADKWLTPEKIVVEGLSRELILLMLAEFGLTERNASLQAACEAPWLEEKEFYDVMQVYRHCPISNLGDVTAAFENVKKFVRSRIRT